jgi:hypothetical protein
MRVSLLRFLSLVWLSALAGPNPLNAQSSPPPAVSDLEELRQELQSLRKRINQLEAGRSDARPTETADPAQLAAETERILTQYRKDKAAAWKQTHAKTRTLRAEVVAALEKMQADYTRRAHLDQAVAIRDAIRCLQHGGRRVEPDPGRLTTPTTGSHVFFFRVTGASSGSIYGTEFYTSDSHVATAAVHAGILKLGQTGIVKVTTFPTHPQYQGSTQNGITSSSWSAYPGFRIQALDDEDMDLTDFEKPSDFKEEGKPEKDAPICPPSRPSAEDPKGSAESGAPTTANGEMAWPKALPAEAREQIDGHLAAVAELRNATKSAVANLARKAVEQLQPIQDAHTRAARLEDAIGVRDTIRKLSPAYKQLPYIQQGASKSNLDASGKALRTAACLPGCWSFCAMSRLPCGGCSGAGGTQSWRGMCPRSVGHS